jgi:DNA replication and repair protein RecF
MREKIGEWPILLLDEVVAELDAERRAFLLDRIDGVTQTLATTTELDIFTESCISRATVWQVTDGPIDTGTDL